jgi:hypothetical protein
MVEGGADENAALHAAPGLLALDIIPILSNYAEGATLSGLEPAHTFWSAGIRLVTVCSSQLA